jgi:hypothetical protein
MINAAFRGVKLRDTQCGFKAISRACAQTILPLVHDTGWFWDTELLLLAAKGNWRVRYIPVRWQEDTDSRVKIASTVQRPPGPLAHALVRLAQSAKARARRAQLRPPKRRLATWASNVLST